MVGASSSGDEKRTICIIELTFLYFSWPCFSFLAVCDFSPMFPQMHGWPTFCIDLVSQSHRSLAKRLQIGYSVV